MYPEDGDINSTEATVWTRSFCEGRQETEGGKVSESRTYHTTPHNLNQSHNHALALLRLVAIDHDTAPIGERWKEESRNGAILEGTDRRR